MEKLSEICPPISSLPMTKRWGNWKGKTSNIWLKRTWRKLYRENRNQIIIVHGPPGSGKSTSALSLCEMIDPNFSYRNIVFNVGDFCELLKMADKGELPKGSAVLFEESGVAADSRAWHSQNNILLSHILQTFRPMNLVVFNTVPELTLADKRLSQLATCLIECKRINFARKTCAVRIYDPVKYDGKTGKWFKRSVGFNRMSENGYTRTFKFGDVYVKKPTRKVLKLYEKAREKFSTDVIAGNTKLLKKEKKPDVKAPRKKKDIDYYANMVLNDKERFMRKNKVGAYSKFNLAALQFNFAEDGIGLPTARLIRMAVIEKMQDQKINHAFKTG